MYTRFQTPSAVHVLDAPLINIPPDTPGAMFLVRSAVRMNTRKIICAADFFSSLPTWKWLFNRMI